MKSIDPNSSIPGIADFYKQYQGVLVNNGGVYGDGECSVYEITTEIRTFLKVELIGERITLRISDIPEVFESGYEVNRNVVPFVVKVYVPSKSRVLYTITGLNQNETPLSQEVLLVQNELAINPFHMLHNHDGRNSRKVALSSIYIPPGAADHFVKSNAAGTALVLVSATSPPDAPLLTAPADNAELDIQDGDITFTWTLGTTGDIPTLVVMNETTGVEISNTASLADVETKDVAINLFVKDNAYTWHVIAANGTGTATSETRFLHVYDSADPEWEDKDADIITILNS